MELPITTVSGILRRSPESRRDSQLYDETVQSSPTFQDKGSVRFVDEEMMKSGLLGTPLEKVRFNYDRSEIDNVGEEVDEDYSASVSAILQRRASSRRGKRRSSSPFSHEDFSAPSSPRRRSSAYTTTSETAISIEDPNLKDEEQILENIRLHKEVIDDVKHQPWPIRRKLKLIQQAKSYIKRHEGELQVRLKKSRSTRDILTRFNIFLVKKWHHTKRELINFMNLLIPWELRIKEIESHFGTVVASYFTFLRWLFWVNLVTSIILTAFVIVPEILFHPGKDREDDRKKLLKEEKTPSLDMLLNFDGVIIHSPIFYGWYSNCSQLGSYKIPTAYFMIGIGVYIYSFIATLRKMAVNFRLSKLSEKEDECIFTWKLFTGWDYMIGNAETGHNRTSSIMLGFKEALLEEAEKKKEKRSWKVISVRIFVNVNVVWMLIFSAKAVIYSQTKEGERIRNSESFFINWWYQNETTVVMTVIGSVFPFIFEMFGLIEKYHPRKTLRIQLARIMALNLLNLYTLTFTQFNQINVMTKSSTDIRQNVTWMNLTNGNEQLNPSPAHFQNPFPRFFSGDYEDLLAPPGASARSKRDVEHENYWTFGGIDVLTRTTSLKEHFLRNQGEFTDPATGTYGKPLPSTQSLRKLSSLIRSSVREQLSSFATFLSPTVFNATTFGTTTETTRPTRGLSELHDTPTGSLMLLTTTLPGSANNFTPIPPNRPTDTVTSTDDQFVTDDDFNQTLYENDTYSSTNWSTEDYEEEWSDNSTTESTTPDWTESFENETTLYDTTEMTSTSTTKMGALTPVTSSTISVSPVASPSVSSVSESTFREPATSTSPVTIVTITSATTTTTEESSATVPINVSSVSDRTTSTSQTPPTIPPSESTNSVFGTEGYEDLCIKKAVFVQRDDQLRVRKLCWETMFGQELVKLTVMDLFSSFLSTFFGDFIRALLVRYMNKIWCWDLEKKFPKYADFKIAENILHLVNNQGLVWMGMFFSPGLPLINVVKLMIMMYLRSWAVLTCNVPHEVVFRASRSNNFYLALLLTMLFLCVLPVCYAIVWLKPSWHCGPFSNYPHIYKIFAKTLQDIVPRDFHNIMSYMASPGTIIPLIIVLLLVIYYLASLTAALREANIDLKIQLRRERTEERKKMFQMASRRKRGGSDIDSTFAKWKKVLQEAPSIKLSDESPHDFDPVDNGYIVKHDEREKIKTLFKFNRRIESPAEEKWDTLLKMVPKTSPKTNVKGSSSTTSSPKDDSSAPSEAIPEIKISRVLTMENILKSSDAATTTKSKQQRKTSQTSENEKAKDTKVKPSFLEKWQQRHKETTKQSAEPPLPASDPPIEQPADADLDDVFLQSVVLDVPELPNIPDNISNRIKRRLRKVISVGSSSEGPGSIESEFKSTEPTSSQSSENKKEHKKSADDLLKALRQEETLFENNRPLLKADSWHTALGEKLPSRIQRRRRSSLNDLCELHVDHN